ncbi:MAG: universal stress protein [Anaerolineae bacterium]
MANYYKHILVPLDGSELAESALPHAFEIATAFQTDITLIQVVLPIKEVIAPESEHPYYVDEQWQDEVGHDREYLHRVCERVGCGDLTIHTVIEMGSAAETIIDYASHHAIDMIVMATHGRSGFQRWVYGSVADKVLRGAKVPTLLVRCHTSGTENA